MAEALSRRGPRIDDRAELDRVVKRLVAALDPAAIYLFGSRARGDAQDDSDYDLMLILRDETPAERARQSVWQAARSGRIDVNPFMTREGAFAWRRYEVGTLEHEADLDGLQLHPRKPLPRHRPTWEPRSMNVNVVEEWLRRVDKDLGVARLCCDADDPLPDQAAYHIQQAAEKLTKGALVAHLVRPGKGHKIEVFASRLPETFPLKERFHRLERFSKFAWAHRYPEYPSQEPVPEPSVEQARAWLEEIAALKADLERWLGQVAGGAGER